MMRADVADERPSPPVTDVLRTVIDLTGQGLTKPLAEAILNIDFSAGQSGRIRDLNGKANEGTLSDEETSELEAYLQVGDLLAYWQSDARLYLTSSSG
jgi:hypothetical protein